MKPWDVKARDNGQEAQTPEHQQNYQRRGSLGPGQCPINRQPIEQKQRKTPEGELPGVLAGLSTRVSQPRKSPEMSKHPAHTVEKRGPAARAAVNSQQLCSEVRRRRDG